MRGEHLWAFKGVKNILNLGKPVAEAKPAAYTSPPVVADNSSGKTQPEFIRLPKSGMRCPWTGLSRSGMNALILPSRANNFQAPVRSVSLRQRGQVKATRLIIYDSLVSHLYGLENQQTQ
jgi:hypothetical protein